MYICNTMGDDNWMDGSLFNDHHVEFGLVRLMLGLGIGGREGGNKILGGIVVRVATAPAYLTPANTGK